ncbi:MAG: glycoside hydrolase family 16 protein [Deltaproteobacteria bacterium]|nr:glycoside hydrolase family 16 protein [Deltaproteobacteria bacterium]
MSKIWREESSTSQSDVTPVARHRHARVGGSGLALLVAAGVIGMSAACGSDADGGGPSSTSGEIVSDGGPGGSRVDSPVDPNEVFCDLAGPPAKTPGETLVFSDEFEGDAIDTTKWTIANGYKGHDNILNTTSPENVVVRDGMLSIRTDRNFGDLQYPYISGYIDTLGKYARTYGHMVFRARFPKGDGIWYAIWSRPWWESFPEMDIEVVNRPGVGYTQTYLVNHWAGKPMPLEERRTYVLLGDEIDYSQFHEYSIVWRPGHMEWQIDGVTKLVAPPKGIPTKPIYWIVNGWAGGWIGEPDAATPLPATFDVDYMRVYRIDGEIADPEIKVVAPKPTYSRQNNLYVVAANFDEACFHVSMYDGATLVRKTAQRPFKFPTAKLTPGPHELRFEATDGVRTATTKISVTIQ